MKRSLDHLHRDERGRQEDELRRGEQERDAAASQQEKKKKTKEEKFSEKWRAHVRNWDAMGLQSVTAVSLPVPDPPCTFTPAPYAFLDYSFSNDFESR